MNEELPRGNATSQPLLLAHHRPWGQIGWFLFGISMCFKGIQDVGELLGVIAPSTGQGLAGIGAILILTALGCSVPALVVRRRAQQGGTVVQHLPWLRKVNFGLLAVTVLLLMLSLIAPAMNAARTAQSQAVADGPWSEHSFANAVFQVSTPANWEQHADPSITNSGIWLTDRQNDLHLIASATQKQDLAIPSLEALQQHVLQTLQQNAVDLRISEKMQIQVDDRPAVEVAMAGTFNGVNLIFYSRLVEYPDTWVEVRLWTTPSRFQEHEATFGRIASTLHQKK